jgi:hypothetical protein
MKEWKIQASSKEAMDSAEANTEKFLKDFARTFGQNLVEGESTVSFDRQGDTEATVSINEAENDD